MYYIEEKTFDVLNYFFFSGQGERTKNLQNPVAIVFFYWINNNDAEEAGVIMNYRIIE